MTDALQRTAWIDVLKSIAIIAVVIAHHPLVTQKIFYIIFFSIPLFFFVSGYLFNPNVTFHELLRRRFDTIFKPYIFTVFVVSIVYIAAKDMPAPPWYVFWAFYGNGPNLPKLALHLWFLPCLFATTVFVWLALRYFHRLKSSIILQTFFIVGLFIAGSFTIHLFWHVRIPNAVTDFFFTDGHLFLINGLVDNPTYQRRQLLQDNQFILNGLPWSLDVVFFTAAFFISGYAVRMHKLERYFNKHTVAAGMLAVFAAFHYYFDYTLNFNDRLYDSLIMCTIVAFAGIYVSTYVSFAIGSWNNIVTKVLQYIGKYSLIIFIFHPIIQIKFYYTLALLLPPQFTIGVILASLVAGIFLPLLLNWLLIERFSFFRIWYYAK